MAVVTWYRGFALGVEPANKDSGGMHDIGDGIYFTMDLETARSYAKLRNPAAGSNGMMVYQVKIDMDRVRVLNLVDNARWQAFLRNEMMPGGPANQQFMKMGSEQYGRFFSAFCKQNNINLNNYDMIIAQDFHSGNTGRTTVQMSLQYKNGGYTTLHGEVLTKMQLVEKKEIPVRVKADPTLVVGGPNTTPGAAIGRTYLDSRMGPAAAKSAQEVKLERAAMGAQTRNAKVVGQAQQNAEAASLRWTGYAVAVSKAAFFLNSASLEYRVKQELIKRQSEITAAFEKKLGVLVIIHVAVEKHSEAGFNAKSYESLWLQPGHTADESMALWKQVPRMFAALPRNAPYEFTEEYRWLDVNDQL